MPTFTARIEKNWIMRCVLVPVGVMRDLGGEMRFSVVAEYAGEKMETTVMPAGRGRGRLTVLMDILRPHGLDVGDELKVNLKRATNSREPSVPADLQRALQFRPVAQKEFVEGPPFQRRWIVKFLDEAKRAETRCARIDVVLERLAERAAKRKARA
jgi:hypothetical protein